MKNIRIYKAPKYSKSKYSLVEENIWSYTETNSSGVLIGIQDEELADLLRNRNDWKPAVEPYDDLFCMLEYGGKTYFKDMEEEDIYIEETGKVSYVTSIVFEQEPEYGENTPENPKISQYPLEDVMDTYYVSISDFYKRKNKADSINSYLEFESDDIADIRSLLTIIGKHVYNKSNENSVELVIE